METVRILVVDDNEGDIILIKEALEEINKPLELIIVNNGKDAFDYINRENNFIEAKRPDLILLDVNLPKKNGFEVLQHIKTDELLKSIPVIIFTTSSAEKDINFAYNHFANCFITKPADVNQFLYVVASTVIFWISIVQLSSLKNVLNEKR